MNKKNIIFVILLVIFTLCGVFIGSQSKVTDVYENNETNIKKSKNMLSMMLETEVDSGNYEMTTKHSWPIGGYKFNSELSKCENGGELAWDEENKRVLMSGNVSDKCYVYFDKVLIKISASYSNFSDSGFTINAKMEDESLNINDYFTTFYYSVDDGATYVNSSSNSYAVSNLSGDIYKVKVYAEGSEYGKSEIYSGNIANNIRFIFENGEFGSNFPINDSNSNLYYINDVILGNNIVFYSNAGPIINGDIFLASYGNISFKGLIFNYNDSFSILSKNGDISLTDCTIQNYKNIFLGSDYGSINFRSNTFENLSGSVTININNASVPNFYNCMFRNSNVVIKIVDNNSSFVINSLSDLPENAKNFLQSFIDTTLLDSSVISFDFYGFKFSYQEAQSYFSS